MKFTTKKIALMLLISALLTFTIVLSTCDLGSTGGADNGSSGASGSEASSSADSGTTGSTEASSSEASSSVDSGASGSTDSGSSGPVDSEASGSTDSGSFGPVDSGASGSTDSESSGPVDSGASGSTDSESSGPVESGEITKQNLDNICSILEGAGLCNVDVFKVWVSDYLAGADPGTADEVSGFSDADCRMTVMLLAGDSIKYDSVQKSYDGTYLMFDLEAIDNQSAYSMLQKKRQLFTTLFGEMPASKSGFKNAFPNRLKKYGIRFTGKKFSIISIVFKTYGEDQAFVGHTGILVDCRNMADAKSNYLFVEKIAFGDAFKATPVKDEAGLLKILSQRPDYSVEEGDPTPLVYKDDVLIGELEM